MNLTIGDITFSGGEAGYASATATVETGEFPFMLCRIGVSVPLVEGKPLEQYERELTDKAKARITEIYKKIVCAGNEAGEQSAMMIATSPKDIIIEIGFPEMKSTIDKMEINNKPDDGEERDFYGLDISYKKTLNSDIVIRGLVDVEKNAGKPTIHLLYSEDYDEQASFSEFRSRAEKYARDVYRKIKASD
ncbi:hypothetical protein RJV04_000776 [Salmonella enterica]|nr:hypothetical protein [Salmonella enterica]